MNTVSQNTKNADSASPLQQHKTMNVQLYQHQPLPLTSQMDTFHGKRPSLAAFDPLDASNSASNYNNQIPSSISPIKRHSSPSVGALSPNMKHQPMTPPSTGRPIATAQKDAPKNQVVERFDNEKVAKNPVKKFLKKASLVKSLSFGQRSPKDKGNISSPVKPKGNVSPPATSPSIPMLPASNVGMEKENTQTQGPMGGISHKRQSSTPPEIPSKTMAQDLMELGDTLGNLQLPALLAKNAPTSFLTGTSDEVITTNASSDPTPFQLEIPSLSEVVITTRLNEFVENYRQYDQNLDLSQFVGLNRMELMNMVNLSKTNNSTNTNNNSNTIVKEHIPVIESLLDTSEGQEISIQGFLTEGGDLPADSRVEAVIFQGQRNFTVVFRGTTEQQSKVLGNSKNKKRAVPLNPNAVSLDKNVEVYSGFLESYSKVEEECFKLVDQLVDENPFCDVSFSGYSFGAALATLAAFRYATARPIMRVGCLTLASPKVGFSHFQHAVNTTPNLKVMRLELGGHTETMCQGPTVGGWHVGHTLVLNSHGSSGNSSNSNANPSNDPKSPTSSSQGNEKQPSVSVYKFEAPKHKASGFFKSSNPGLRKYISILENLATLQKNGNHLSWPKDFANNAGAGVVVNNENRLVV